MMKTRTLLFLLSCTLISFSQTIKYINPLATGNGSGTTWANAYTNLKTAFASAKDNDEFWLTYNSNFTIDPTQNNVYIVIDKKISVYGGFKGTETARTQRTSQPSIISGSIAMSVVDDNSQKAFEIKSNVTFDGLRFSDFYSTEINYNDKVGIVKVNDNATVSFKNCDFRNNESVRCIDILNNANIKIDNSTFYTNNRTKNAPIIKILNSVLTINNSNFQFNGAGSFIIESITRDTLPTNGDIKISNSNFNENKAGVVYNNISNVSIDNCTIKNDDFYNHTVYQYAIGKSLKINKTNFSGYFKSLVVNFGQIDSLLITNSNFDLALANNTYMIYGGAKNVKIKNCDFGQFDKSVDPVYIYGADSSVLLSKINFKDLIRNDNLFYISGKKSIKMDSCTFENITYENGSNLFYLYADSVIHSNTKFSNVVGELFPTYNPYKKFFNCTFKNIKLKSTPIFYQSNGGFLSEIENCTFDSLEIGISTFINHGYPFIYNGSGDLILKNNSFKNIKSNDHFIEVGSFAKVKSYGNLFENIKTNKGIWQNAGGNLGVFNCNFNRINKPIIINDDTYSFNPKESRLFVLNSVLYSTNDTLVKVVATNTIPTTVEGNYTNKNLGPNNINFSLIPYSDLYKVQNQPVLFDKGLKGDSTLAGIKKDILGNARLLFSKIDIGCYELTSNPNVVLAETDITASVEITVYPNPATDKITVTLEQNSNVKISNAYGQTVFETELQAGKNEVNVNGLEAGMYILTTQFDNKVKSTKFSIK